MSASIVRYIAYWPANLAFVLLSYLLSPVLAALSLLTGPRLPGILQWFSTLDADLDGGIGQGVKGYRADLTGWGLWWQRTCWICRNPAHGWQSRLLGMPAAGTIIIKQQITETPKNQWYVMETAKGVRFFCFKRDQPLVGGFYLKIWLGWVNKAYDGRNHHYSFQIGPKRRS
ncbi:hypothetical protein HJB76_02135 [Rhizobium lentis]|uniref:DUF7338 family protein n=1 Tax=Rhizobium lentis TaxID=1138194 RepID=UPI001C8372EE|nr:hypothetical protein [Rhizobium lentis]MBX4954293.1 hypothetical protein [Rhizobium lentis]MBX4972175.1 hypothetical protein [Rhizobium lentis]MBX4984304.1 hypothetical protein [Rhizobium lentis]MBX5027593.1 hypothetical protein [Rhizobium lentis]MBX5148488.1 hypothetical protein [Rhizobium lentis]